MISQWVYQNPFRSHRMYQIVKNTFEAENVIKIVFRDANSGIFNCDTYRLIFCFFKAYGYERDFSENLIALDMMFDST